MSDLLKCVRIAVEDRIGTCGQSVAHRFDHLERVMRNAKIISATMDGVDSELLDLAVLLHDVDQPVGKKSEHVSLSMKAAEKILRTWGCPAERAKLVLRIISEHSSEHVEDVKPTSVESKILFDADKLDGLGAVGISRVFALFGQMNRSTREAIEWYRKKMSIARDHLQTEEGKRLFRARLPYVQQFLEQLESELEADSLSFPSSST